MHRTKPLPATCHGWRHSPSEGSAIEMKATRRHAAALAGIVTATAGLLAGTGLTAGAASAGGFPAFTGPLHHVTTLASTVPGNGDVNPYGMAVRVRGAQVVPQHVCLARDDLDGAVGPARPVVQHRARGQPPVGRQWRAPCAQASLAATDLFS